MNCIRPPEIITSDLYTMSIIGYLCLNLTANVNAISSIVLYVSILFHYKTNQL